MKSIVTWIKNIKTETKVLIGIFVAIFVFVWLMPKIYITFRDGIQLPFNNSSNQTSNNQPTTPTKEPEPEIAITCSATIKDELTETEKRVVLHAKGKKFQKQETYFSMKALTDEGKSIVESQKLFQEDTLESYKKYNGFMVTTAYENDIYEYSVIADYTKLDVGRVNSDYETDGKIYLEFRLNQDIDSVKQYFIENQGLTCK